MKAIAELNYSLLEPSIAKALSSNSKPLYVDQENLLVQHSIAISLKRIADILEANVIKSNFAIPTQATMDWAEKVIKEAEDKAE